MDCRLTAADVTVESRQVVVTAGMALDVPGMTEFHLRDWGHEAAYSLDPDGHVLAFARVHEGS